MLEIVYKCNKEGINEKCVKNDNGDFIGIDSGKTYPKVGHYSCTKILGKVIKIDQKNLTGMFHLGLDSLEYEKKKKFIGCIMTFREAHMFGNIKVYQSYETGEYFSQNELEIIQ